jgi:hypothetical protein
MNMLANKMTLKNKCTLVILFSVAINYAQTNLPVERTTWNTTPLGWTDWGTTANTSNTDASDNFGKLGNTGDYYEIAFTNIPSQLTYTIKGESFSGGIFYIQESPDGIYWTNIKNKTTVTENWENQKFKLKRNSRFVRFYYNTKKEGNVVIDEVVITTTENRNKIETQQQLTTIETSLLLQK